MTITRIKKMLRKIKFCRINKVPLIQLQVFVIRAGKVKNQKQKQKKLTSTNQMVYPWPCPGFTLFPVRDIFWLLESVTGQQSTLIYSTGERVLKRHQWSLLISAVCINRLRRICMGCR